MVWLVVVTTANGAENILPSKLQPVPPFPALTAAAKLHGIPLEGMDAVSVTNVLQTGDSANVLVTFTQKQKRTQWLLHLEVMEPDPAKPVPKRSKFTVNSGFGTPFKFESRRVPVKLRLFGPFAAAGTRQPKSEEKVAQFHLQEDFLALGLDQAAALLYRWSQTTNFGGGAITSRELRAMNPTTNEQRALCATFPALLSYFNIVQHTEGLKDLFFKLVDLPSLWSMVKHRGVQADFAFGNGALPIPVDAKLWSLPASTPVYTFPWLLKLNGQPALKVTMVVTSPQSPLLICGGVTGLLAEKVDDEKTYMTLRLISAGRK